MDRGKRIQSVVQLIEAHGHRCAIVGGIAVTIRSRERFTKDIDFAVAVANDADAEALVRAFKHANYGIEQVLENTAKRLLATVRFSVPGGRVEPELDLLFASSGIEAETVAEAESIEVLPGVVAPVARLHHLIAMKVLAESDVREQDRVDLRLLVATASKRELELAREAVRLIENRGFARGKKLEEVLDSFLKR